MLDEVAAFLKLRSYRKRRLTKSHEPKNALHRCQLVSVRPRGINYSHETSERDIASR